MSRIVLVTFIALAGCGGEPAPTPSSTSVEPTVPHDGVAEESMTDSPDVATSLPAPPRSASSSTANTGKSLEISVADAEPLLNADGVYWIDCREQDEWDAGHIDGAHFHPLSQIDSEIAKLADKKDDRVIVYCRSGGRSLRVAKQLRENGFSNAQSMAGGITDWAEEVDASLTP